MTAHGPLRAPGRSGVLAGRFGASRIDEGDVISGSALKGVVMRGLVIVAGVLVAGAAVGGAVGCSAYLAYRDTGFSGGLPLFWRPWAVSALSPGEYAGQAECALLAVEASGEPVLEEFEASVNLVVEVTGAMIRDGEPIEAGATVEVRLGRFTLEEMVTAVNSARSMVSVNFDARLTLDAQTQFPVRLLGQGAETYTPQADGSIAYALAVEMKQQNEDGSAGALSVACQCQGTLSR